MSVIMTMFILMLFTVISIVVFVAGVLLRLKRGVRDTFRRSGRRDEEERETPISTQRARRGGKVFGDDEGEYVDFEEITD